MVDQERHLASHVFNLVVLAVSGVLLGVLVHRLGFANARRVVADVGGWFGVVLALDLAALACDAGALHAFMRPEARMVSYWRVLAAQTSGRAVNILTPGGALGEATKLTMLVSHAPRTRVVSSIVLLDLATLYLSVAILIVGVPVTAMLVDLPHHLAVVVWTGLAVILPLVIGIGVVIHRGALATVLSTARALRFVSQERVARWQVKLADVDRHLRDLQSARSPGSRTGFALLGVSRLLSWTATATVLHVIGVTLHPTLLVGVFSVGVLISWISSIVPFGIGVADGSNYALFDVLGASGVSGVFMTMLARARSLTLALLGLLVMAAAHTANRIAIARRNRRRAALAAERSTGG